jgi:hypothetical protein
MALTKAQGELLRKLENGCEITFKDEHYTVVGPDQDEKIWPSTFYGLYDQRLVKRLDNGNYTASEDGIRQIRSESK